MARKIKGLLIYGVTLIAILLLGFPPLIVSLLGELVGCKFELWSSHPCIVLGADLDKLSMPTVALSFLTVPAGVVALSIWLLMFIFHIIIMLVRRLA